MDAQTVIDELNLKVAASVIGICDDERRGIITKAQANTAIRAVFDAVSGLVSQDNFDLMSAVSEEYKHEKGVEATFIKNGDEIIGTIRICGAGALLSFRGGKPIRLPQHNTEREVDAEAKQDQADWHQSVTDKLRQKREQGAW